IPSRFWPHARGLARVSLENIQNCLDDLILGGKDLRKPDFICSRQKMITASGVVELCRHAKLIAGTPHAALQDCADTKLLPDGAYVTWFAFELECRSPRRHVDAFDLGKCVDHLFGEPVAEVFQVALLAEIDEGKDHH